MSWIKDLVQPEARKWEEFYRNRWQHDKTVRSTHGVNCTGGCSWMIFVKEGIITWEMQATDYPLLESGLPPYEPRGCQRGISFSWYIYSPIRVKYPYLRGALMDLWRAAKRQYADPVKAWASIVDDPAKRARYQSARGKGGFRRSSWDEALELIAASTIHTIKNHGPDRVTGFAPIPAMSYLSYAGGSRFLQLLGGVNLSFYDWYADLPNAFPETWGEQTDVCESADWYNARYIVAMGSNLNMTRTPDVHFISEARYKGAKFVVFTPDFSQVAKFADWWVPIQAGQDGAFWMAVDHVILKEFHADREVPYFIDYLKRYSDAPFLVRLNRQGDEYRAGRMLTAADLAAFATEENADWKFLVFDQNTGDTALPLGSMGFRWQSRGGKWNLQMKDARTGEDIEPALSFLDGADETVSLTIDDFAGDKRIRRGIPVKYVETRDGVVPVATVYDLLMAQFGVGRGLSGDYPESYDDEDGLFTPAWQERYTGIGRETVIRFAREFAGNAEATEGKSMVIIGASVNHWFYNNMAYRGPITALLLCGCCGKNGGGLNHYVGQEKLTLVAPWTTLAMALDWSKPPRVGQSPIWHYMHSDQWRYEGDFTEYATVPGDARHAKGHAADLVAQSVRRGWMPFFPQFDRNPLDVVKEAEAAGARSDDEIVRHIVGQLRKKNLRFAVEDVDAPANWPRIWIIWRGNALLSSAKGHEFFLRHYLGTHDLTDAEEAAADSVEDVVWHKDAPRGKMDLIVDINFRMDTTALYSDIVLPTATWYEKNDLNTTDLHSYVHPLGQAVPPCWESKSDWDIFKSIAGAVSRLAATHLPEPIKDVVAVPINHDTPDAMGTGEALDWAMGECDPIPGKTMPRLVVVERDYTKLYDRFIAFGPKARQDGVGVHGIHVDIADEYDRLANEQPATHFSGGAKHPSVSDALDAANLLLRLAPETNGELAYRAFQDEEARVGLPLADLAEGNRGIKYTFKDITAQPRRTLISPMWTGMVNDGRPYAAYCINVERLVPWRTLTGRQHFYVDHPWYLDFGEHIVTYKPRLRPQETRDIRQSRQDGKAIALNFITPHGKWHIHSTYYDNHRMLTLSRGIEPCWLNDEDAAAIGVKDNDWVEIYNDNGVMVTRSAVSRRVQKGTCMVYHSPERTISIPKSQVRGGRRGGGHNSLTRTRINPVYLAGGYGQIAYAFNYWGPTGVFTRDTFVLVRKLDRLEW